MIIHGALFKLVDDTYDMFDSKQLMLAAECCYLLYISSKIAQQKYMISMIGFSVIVATFVHKVTGNSMMMNYQNFRIKYILAAVSLPLLWQQATRLDLRVVHLSCINMCFTAIFYESDKLYFKKETSLGKIMYRLFFASVFLFTKHLWKSSLIKQSQNLWTGYAFCSSLNMIVKLAFYSKPKPTQHISTQAA
jgi:hypothetical protein